MISNQAKFFLILMILFGCSTSKNPEKKIPFFINKNIKADELNGGLYLPGGFEALVVTEGVGPSRHIAVNDNGDIYVKLRTATGRNGNVALRDEDNDGKADIVERFGDYPNDGKFGTEMKINDGYLYFSSELVVYRQKLKKNKLIPEGKPEIILVDPYPIRWHNAKSLAFDDEDNIYVTFSAPTNACENWETKPNTYSTKDVKGEYPCEQLDILGGIWKFNKNKLGQSLKDGKRYATGIRSVVGLTWNKLNNSLYGVNHGRDFLHNHAPQYYSEWENTILPAEEFMRIEDGDDYGWPYTYYDHFKNKRMLAPEYGGDGKKISDNYTKPIMGLPAHWAPNDLLFYTGDQFPDRYKNGAFIAFHGSTNRVPYPQAGYVVGFIPFKEGVPSGKIEIFADGFAGKSILIDMEDANYRPMGLAQGPDGSLYISESKKGKIWRVFFSGNKINFGEKELEKMIKREERSYTKIPDEIKDKLE
ncbi:MAG: PQQ-dependent sugar dehydrogenase [Cytophagales bacterium]|nr:MAG: sorbosone dehydrogenase [Rhodothermaeota bacterium MED-G16]